MAEEYVLARTAPLTISAEEADKLLALGSGDAALLYLWLLRHDGRFDRELAGRELKTSLPLQTALAQLRSAGLVRGEAGAEAPPAPPIREELSEPTAAEITDYAERDPGFRQLVGEAANRLGRVLSGGDLKILYGIYHELGLPTEVILLLLVYCCEDYARRYGPGRKPTMRQVEKEAYYWHNRELFTLELADKYMMERKARLEPMGELCRLLGIRNRALSETEERYLQSWLEMGFGKEAVLLAYDKTVAKKGELAWPYMNRILENWHAKGLHTLAEIEAGDAPPSRRGRSPAGRSGGNEPAGPTTEEYMRMQKLLKKLDGGGDHGT
jgi:DnaD/phage-associated family protein